MFLNRKLFSTESPKKILCSSSRFGDLEEQDFDTPRRAKKSFNYIKRTVLDLREKNRRLVQQNHRLEQKIHLLENIIKDQNDKLLQTKPNNSKVYISIFFFFCLQGEWYYCFGFGL